MVRTPKMIRVGNHVWRYCATPESDGEDRFDELVDALCWGLTKYGFGRRMEEAVFHGKSDNFLAVFVRSGLDDPKGYLVHVKYEQGKEGGEEVDFAIDR